MERPILYIVLPCYNEEPVLHETSGRLLLKLGELIDGGELSSSSRIMFVDDGSTDRTWSIIRALCENNELFAGVKLSRNRGHQNALLAGLMAAREHADIVISMDADLQDDIGVIDGFLSEFKNGADVVYGVRSSRKSDTFFKRNSALMFYRLMTSMGVDIVENHADCRLMSKRALESLSQFSEVNLFLRGLVPLVGYKSAVVAYERSPRFAGESKYPFKKMLSFALDGITSFSVKPIKLIMTMGLALFFVSIIMLLYGLISKLLGSAVSGWTSLICSIWMIGGLQLLALGLIGEYIGKIYSEVKSRPRYIIEETLIR